jgi:hypothetical protein
MEEMDWKLDSSPLYAFKEDLNRTRAVARGNR